MFDTHTDEGLMAATDHHIAMTDKHGVAYADAVGAEQERLMRTGMDLHEAFVAAVNTVQM